MRQPYAKLVLAPLASFVLVLIGFQAFQNLRHHQEQRQARRHLEQLAQETADRLHTYIDSHFKLISLLDRFLEKDREDSEERFRQFASVLFEDYPGLSGILWLNPEGQPRVGLPVPFYNYYQTKNFSTDKQGSQLLYQSELREQMVVAPRPMKLGDQNILGVFKASSNRTGQVKGYLFGAFDLEKLFNELIIGQDFVALEIRDGQELLWSSQPEPGMLAARPRTFQVANRVWTLNAFAQQQHLQPSNGEMTPLIIYSLVIALSVSFLVFLLMLKQHAHQQSKRRLSVLISNLPGMAYRLENRDDWIMAFVSRGSLELTGYHPEQLTGVHAVSFANVVDPRDQAHLRQTVDHAINAGLPYRVTYRIITADDHEKWVWESGCGVFNRQKQLEAIEGFICDITDRVHAETELRNHRDQLEATVAQRTQAVERAYSQLQREVRQRVHTEGQLRVLLEDLERANHELDEFARITSHDLKAPLRGMRDLILWLREDLGENLQPKAMARLEDLQARVTRLSLLIDGILRYSRAGVGRPKLQIVESKTILEDVIRSLHPAPTYRFEIPDEMPMVNYDATQLHQVFQNLMSNALQHTSPEGGIIRIESSETDLEWCFSVQDNGCGIDPAYIDQIFQMFSKAGPQDGQTSGIGLAIVKKIVEHNHGTVKVTSEMGRGSTFVFTIPKHHTTGSVSSKHHHILVFDHNQDFARITAKVLQREGHMAATASSSAETFEYLNKHHNDVDVLLLDADYNPDISFQVFNVIRANHPAIRIVACSGVEETQSKIDFSEYDGLLYKPFELQELFDILEEPTPKRT